VRPSLRPAPFDLTFGYADAISAWGADDMSRPASFLVVLMFSVMLTGLSSAEAGGGSCQKIVGKSYICTRKFTGGSENEICWKFETGGISSQFDLYTGAADYGCTCEAKGSFKSPSFNSSSTFDCIDSETGFQFHGKMNSKGISGQGSSENGESDVFSCMESATACP